LTETQYSKGFAPYYGEFWFKGHSQVIHICHDFCTRLFVGPRDFLIRLQTIISGKRLLRKHVFGYSQFTGRQNLHSHKIV